MKKAKTVEVVHTRIYNLVKENIEGRNTFISDIKNGRLY